MANEFYAVGMTEGLTSVLSSVGPRLRHLRQQNGTTLAQLSQITGISISTLSRLESGHRKPTLELLLSIAQAHDVPLDELIRAHESEDPRIHQRPFIQHGVTFVPLTRNPGRQQAYKQMLPGRTDASELEQRVHDGYGWIYVLTGRLRLVLGKHDLTLNAGEVAEFDTRMPHAYGSAGPEPVEILSLFGPQGERIHVRARTSRASS